MLAIDTLEGAETRVLRKFRWLASSICHAKPRMVLDTCLVNHSLVTILEL